MDRLFLAGLVRELDRRYARSRIRSVHVAADGRSLVLGLKPAGEGPRELVCHLGPGPAGLFSRAPELDPKSVTPRTAKLKKLLSSSSLVSVGGAELDRVARLTVEQTRLSGKKRRFAVVLELVATRTSLYVVELGSARVIERLAARSARLQVGDRFVELAPPPHSNVAASSADELAERLADARVPYERTELLAATGWTPLLVRELEFWVEHEDGGEDAFRRAFDRLNARLLASTPYLYWRNEKPVLSPIELTSLGIDASPYASFEDAVKAAIEQAGNAERVKKVRHSIDAATSKRLANLGRLRKKLETQRKHLPEPSELRRRGETLLAGLASAVRLSDDRVRVTDAFDPDGRAVEIDVDPKLPLTENAERFFRRSRKAERTERELEERLRDLAHAIEYAEALRVSVEDAASLDVLAALRREAEDQGILERDAKARSQEHRGRLPPRSFPTEQGNVVLVGRSARSNDELTFRIAKPDDLWFHAHRMPGSHVVLQVAGGTTATPAERRQAAGLAAHFSKGRRAGAVDVMVTERRHVSKIKGAPPGLVRVASFETIRVRPTPPPG